MVALWIVGILLALIVLILLLRAGVRVRWGEELTVSAVVGPIKLQLVPKPKKEKPKKEKKKKTKGNKPQSEGKKPKKKKPELTFADIRTAVPALFNSLKRGLRKTGRRMRVDPMKLSVVFGGDDPANVAETYGWASSAMWAIMPELEKLMRIPDPQLHLDVDFDAGKTRSEGEFGVWFRIHDFLAIGLAFGIPLLKWFVAFKKSKKPAKAAKQGNTSPETKQEETIKNDEKIKGDVHHGNERE